MSWPFGAHVCIALYISSCGANRIIIEFLLLSLSFISTAIELFARMEIVAWCVMTASGMTIEEVSARIQQLSAGMKEICKLVLAQQGDDEEHSTN